jgi:hypothetical protein
LNAEEAKSTAKLATKAAVEFSQNRKDACNALQVTRQLASDNKKLWKEGHKSRLIQIGMALIVFPEPTPVSEIIGVGFLAAGAIQKGIKNQSIYMEDIPKSLQNAFKEIYAARYDLRI